MTIPFLKQCKSLLDFLLGSCHNNCTALWIGNQLQRGSPTAGLARLNNALYGSR